MKPQYVRLPTKEGTVYLYNTITGDWQMQFKGDDSRSDSRRWYQVDASRVPERVRLAARLEEGL